MKHELLQQVVFYIFAGLAILSAFLVIVRRNPVQCVLYLVLAFFASTVLWLMLEVEFLALVLILVYVGAVMTLFLFVIMMLNIDTELLRKGIGRYIPLGLLVVAALVGLLLTAIPPGTFTGGSAAHTAMTDTAALGMVLYTDYVLAFECAAVILLVAIVAAITLVNRNKVRSRRQNIVEQIETEAKDRIRMVDM